MVASVALLLALLRSTGALAPPPRNVFTQLLHQHRDGLAVVVEPPPLDEDPDGSLSARLADALGAAAFLVDPVAAPVPPLPALPCVHVFAPVVYFDDRAAPRVPARGASAAQRRYADDLERREGGVRLARAVAPLDDEARLIAAFAGARRVSTARRRGHVDALFAIDDAGGGPWRRGAAARGPAGGFAGGDAAALRARLPSARAYWCDDAVALPEAAVDRAGGAAAEVLARPTRGDARAVLDRCATDDAPCYWLTDAAPGLLPAGSAYVADALSYDLPAPAVARGLVGSGCVAVALRWHAARAALGDDRRWATLEAWSRDIGAAPSPVGASRSL